MIINILGLDPSLRNFGCASGQYDTDSKTININNFTLIQTENGDKKTVRQNSNDLRCASEIFKKLKPLVDQAQIVFCELPVGSQSSRAQTSYGVCLGILGAIQKPLIQLTPLDIKLYVGNKKTTTKDEVISWAYKRHPNANWFLNKSGEPINKNEHLADATASIYAGLETDQFRQLIDMFELVK